MKMFFIVIASMIGILRTVLNLLSSTKYNTSTFDWGASIPIGDTSMVVIGLVDSIVVGNSSSITGSPDAVGDASITTSGFVSFIIITEVVAIVVPISPCSFAASIKTSSLLDYISSDLGVGSTSRESPIEPCMGKGSTF